MNKDIKKRNWIKRLVSQCFGRIAIKVFIVILLFILPFNLFLVFMNHFIQNEMKTKILLSVESVLENHVTLLQNRIDNGLYRVVYAWRDDESMKDMLRQTDDDHYELYKNVFYQSFGSLMTFTDGFDKYFFIIRDREDTLLRESDSEEKEMVWKDYETGSWKKGWSLKNINGKDCMCFYMETKELASGGWFYLDEIKELLEADIQYEKEYCTFTYGPGEEQDGTIKLTGGKVTDEIYLNVYLDEDEILGEINNASLYIRIGTILMLFIFPILYMIIHFLLISPLKRLREGFKYVESGNLDYRITEHANSIEYEHSFKAFNRMVDGMQNLIIENYEKELDKQKMELQNLQLQIRPHFLLNTFNLIYALAQKKESAAIQDIILYLSDYFRYLFRNGKSLELFQKEQALIEGYIKMAQIHYKGCIEIEYTYDPEIWFVRVPPLLIHNFVENIVKHVVKKGQVTHIAIVGQYEKKSVTFMIMDNGQGISKKKLKELDTSMRREKSDAQHVGFYNSLKRIKFFYGDEADILITSIVGKGTTIAVTFPYNLEESVESEEE